MAKYRLLDLFCGEGGCSAGYAEAGFEVVGVDRWFMPKYPFEFIRADATTLPAKFLMEFDAIAASPPCKTHTSMKAFSDPSHEDLIPATRSLLRFVNRPYVMENVIGAPLIKPTMLCGSMFGLFVERHRIFETNWDLPQLQCRHEEQRAASPGFKGFRYHTGKPVEYVSPVVTVVGRGNGYGKGETQLWRDVMGMPWASKDGMREAIPPAYTKWIGERLIEHLERTKR